MALDVYATEPCTSSPLFGMPGVVCTPHLGASTEEAQTQVAIEAVELLVAYLTTGAIRHAVNVASLDPKTLASLRGYLDVAYRLGLLLAGLQPGGIKQCRLLYRGEIADKETKVLTAVFAAGLLRTRPRRRGEPGQRRDAAQAAGRRAGRGISQRHGRLPLVDDGRGRHRRWPRTRPSGTVFGQNMPRLVALDELPARGVPGRLPAGVPPPGRAGHHRQRRHSFWAARREHRPDGSRPGRPRAAQAVGVLNLDGEPPAEALEAVRKLPAIASAVVVQLPASGRAAALGARIAAFFRHRPLRAKAANSAQPCPLRQRALLAARDLRLYPAGSVCRS